MTTQSTRPQTGILVSTSIAGGTASGYIERQHAEGIVVSTGLAAGADSGNGGLATNHGEGLVRERRNPPRPA
jgi:hypothetical protein